MEYGLSRTGIMYKAAGLGLDWIVVPDINPCIVLKILKSIIFYSVLVYPL